MTVFFKRNKDIAVISYSEFWDRFNYYGLQALLVLFLTRHFYLSDHDSYTLYGAYTSLSFGFTILGGLIADRMIGLYSATLLGGVMIALGNIVLTLPSIHAVFIGLSIIITGIGLFKPNNPNLLGLIYQKESLERAKAFSFFYLCINLGSIFGPIVYGLASNSQNYWCAFLFSGIGMLSAVSFMWFFQKPLQQEMAVRKHHSVKIGAILITCVLASWTLLNNIQIFSKCLLIVTVIAIAALVRFLKTITVDERKSMISLFVPIVACIVYFASFLQIYSSLTLFIDRYVNRSVFGWSVPTTWFSSIQPMFIVFAVPFLGAVWAVLNRKNAEPKSKNKVIYGLALASVSFLVFGLSADNVQDHYLTLFLIVLANAILAISELCIIPVTMSITNIASPEKYRGTMMGVFYFSLTLSGYFSGILAKFTESTSGSGVYSFAHTFNSVSIILILTACVLFLVNYSLEKYKVI